MKLEKMLIKSEIKKEGRKMYKELRVRKKKFYGKKRLEIRGNGKNKGEEIIKREGII